MASDVEFQASISKPSQRFEPPADDHETLYEVISITAEKGDRYKVRWKGKDPKTMKPWAQSWVLKTDCTDDLVLEWKRKMKAKRAKKKSRDSTASKRTARTVSIASSSKTTGVPTRQQPIPPSIDTSDANVRFPRQLEEANRMYFERNVGTRPAAHNK